MPGGMGSALAEASVFASSTTHSKSARSDCRSDDELVGGSRATGSRSDRWSACTCVRIARVNHSPIVRPSRSAAAIAAFLSSGGIPFTVQGFTRSVVSKASSVSPISVLLQSPKVRPDTLLSRTFARKSQTNAPLPSPVWRRAHARQKAGLRHAQMLRILRVAPVLAFCHFLISAALVA